MTFKKPKNVKYVDMAIWIDKHALNDDCDEAKLFEYLYHLVFILAFKKRYFKDSKYYDDFALESATLIFFRLKNSRESNLDEKTKLPPIKSILNYIKKSLYPMKVMFEQNNYSQTLSKPNEEDAVEIVTPYIQTGYAFINYELIQSEFKCYLDEITTVFKTFLSKIPYVSTRKDWNNIYISCMLTFLNSITLDRKTVEKLASSDAEMYASDYYIDRLYREATENSTILFHLDQSMENYITVLTNQIKSIIAKELSSIIHTPEASSDVIKNLLISSMTETSRIGDPECD